jgi:hypothetical protein
MNCDDAFERLTSPDAPLDAELDRHLAGCRRCRAMRDTLSPALEWLSVASLRRGTGGRADRRDIFLTDEAVQIAERAARRLAPAKGADDRRRKSRMSRVRWAAAAALVTIGFLAVFVFPNVTRTPTAARSQNPDSAPPACLWSQPELARGESLRTSEQVVSTCVACHLTVP